MSTLKQEILEQVKKGENVLQSSDAGASSANLNEGNIYECRFHAPTYDPSTGDGVLCGLDELRKYTRQDVNGDTQTYVVQKKGQDQSLGFRDSVSGKIGIVGVELNIPQLIGDLTTQAAFVPETALLQNSGKYFTRKFVAEEGPNNSSVTLEDAANTDAKVVLQTPEALEDTWVSIRDRLFTGTPGAQSDAASQGQIVYWVNNAAAGKYQARTLNQKFFGKITSGDTVPADSIFYYDGIDAIFTVDNTLGGGTTQVNKPSAKGFYIAVGADFVVDDHTDVSTSAATPAAAIVADQTTLDSATGSITQYVYGGRPITGGSTTQVRFFDAMGFGNVEDLNFDRFSTEASQVPGLVAAITNPIATTDYWKLEVAVTTPIDENGAAVDDNIFELTTADSLDDRDYWNLISESFVEDHDVPVGTAGLVGADEGGAYSAKESNGSAKANYTGYEIANAGSQTVRVNEIVSTAGSTGDEEVKVTTLFNHGLEVGDAVVITNTGVTEIDSGGGSHEVSAIGGASGTDAKTFSLKDVSKAVLAESNPGQADIAPSTSLGEVTTNGVPHLFWGLHTPPTTDQALVYRG